MLARIKVGIILLACLLLTSCAGSGGAWPTAIKGEVAAARQATAQVSTEPSNIVLMLPMSGGLATTSHAIRNGFLAAYYYSRQQHPEIDIRVVDTTTGSLPILYQQAITSGAEVIVGPLTKQEVESIMTVNPLPAPVIALNTLDDYARNPMANLYQFGLLPQDEAVQVASKMVQESHLHAAIVAPDNAWGHKIVAAFKDKYNSAGGQITATLNYDSSDQLASQVCNFLAADPATLCVKQKHKKDKSEEPQILRRQDIDSIFVVATAKEARQVVPLLKFYYASDLPLYSVSSIYSGIPQPTIDQDLNDVRFCDMPWVLKDPAALSPELQAIHQQITTLWGEAFVNYNRLYALGVDGYNLALNLHTLLNAPQNGMPGASGVLYLDNYNHIYRELEWAQIREGNPVQ